MKLTTFLATILGLVLVVAVVLMPVLACGCKKASPLNACLANLKQTGVGMLQYAEDHDERFPNRDVWMDEIKPYVKDETVFHDPEAPKGAYGYAFDSRLSQTGPPKDATVAPLVFDSRNPIRNAADPFVSLPRPGRHGGKSGVVYADGHTKRIVTPALIEAKP